MHVGQVGGSHYQADYQHWDWVAETGLGYLEGCGSKYVCRWRAKGGLEDLQKALSYIHKIMVTGTPPAGDRPGRTPSKLYRFLKAAGIQGTPEAEVLVHIDNWRTLEDLNRIGEMIERLIHDAAR